MSDALDVALALRWLLGWERYRYRHLPNFPVEVLALVTPANDNRSLTMPHPADATEQEWLLAWRRMRELGIAGNVSASSLHRIKRKSP